MLENLKTNELGEMVYEEKVVMNSEYEKILSKMKNARISWIYGCIDHGMQIKLKI